MGYIFNPITADITCNRKSSLCIEHNYHHHDGYEIFILLNGHINYYIEHQCYTLTRGDMVIMRPDEYHRVELVDTSVYERMHANFREPAFAGFSSSLTDLGICFTSHKPGQNNLAHLNELELREFILLFSGLESALCSTEYGQDLLAVSYALQILIKINRLFLPAIQDTTQKNIMPPLVGDTIQYINQHFTENICLADLERLFYHNGTYISRRFKQTTGLTLQQYILMKRTDLAKTHLQNGKSLMDACQLSGFNNYSNFSRSFAKLVGCSPKQYQKYHSDGSL